MPTGIDMLRHTVGGEQPLGEVGEIEDVGADWVRVSLTGSFHRGEPPAKPAAALQQLC